MLLSHDIAVVECLNASLNRELVALVLLLIHVLHANLVVARVVSGEMMPHYLLIAQSLKFLALRISDRQH